MSSLENLAEIALGEEASGHQCQAALFKVSGADFIANKDLTEEVFGSCSLVVECASQEEMFAVLNSLGGQLTGAIHASYASRLLPEYASGISA